MLAKYKLLIASAVMLLALSACGDRADPEEAETCDINPSLSFCDPDNDGLTNAEEAEIDTDPQDPDTDGDGYIDGTQEHLASPYSNPLDACDPNINADSCDQDNDGLTNIYEIEISKTEPTIADTDKDGLEDGEEVHNIDDNDTVLKPTRKSDPLDPCDPFGENCDRDRDQLSDSTEDANGNKSVDSGETDPDNADTDGDGLEDGEEVLNIDDSDTVLKPTATSDPLNPCDPDVNAPTCDQDNDGLTNKEEDTIGTVKTNPDTDGDGVLDGSDGTNGATALQSCLPVQAKLYDKYDNSNNMWQVENCDGDDYLNGTEDNTSLTPDNYLSDPYDPLGGCFVYEGEVTCEIVALDGRTWMDRPLGASQVCTSKIDSLCYGNLYQWGRGADGHEIRSNTDTQNIDPIVFPYIGSSTHEIATKGDFDWLVLAQDGQEKSAFVTDRTASWAKTVDNPICPDKWYVPSRLELTALANAEKIIDGDTAFASTLKLALSGARSAKSSTIEGAGTIGYIWSRDSDGADSNASSNTAYSFTYDGTATFSRPYKAEGHAIICIKEL